MGLIAHFALHNLDEPANWCPPRVPSSSPCYASSQPVLSACPHLPSLPDEVPLTLQVSRIFSEHSSLVPPPAPNCPQSPCSHRAPGQPHQCFLLSPPAVDAPPTHRLSTTEGQELYLCISRPPGLGTIATSHLEKVFETELSLAPQATSWQPVTSPSG